MFSWMKGSSKDDDVVEGVLSELKKIYKNKLLPLEEHYNFHDFHSPKLEDPDFDAKPMILLVGQYSTGKTTFIRHLLERDFPGIRIGPEPTTGEREEEGDFSFYESESSHSLVDHWLAGCLFGSLDHECDKQHLHAPTHKDDDDN